MPAIAVICTAMRRNRAIETLRLADSVPFRTVEVASTVAVGLSCLQSELGSHIGRMLQHNSPDESIGLKSLDISKIRLRDEGCA